MIDHNPTDLSQIPVYWLERAKQQTIWAYGSTSHGTQVWTGAEHLSEYVDTPRYNFAKAWRTPPSQGTPARLRMGYDDDWSWDPEGFLDAARDLLDGSPSATAFMWSWCGEMSEPDTPGTAIPGHKDQLEAGYPAVHFVYITGHTDGGSGTLAQDNDRVRQHVLENDNVLYEFADIESCDPDGTHYPDADDSCPGCHAWCDAHPEDCQNLPAIGWLEAYFGADLPVFDCECA